MNAAANSPRRFTARLGPALIGASLPALLWAAPAAKHAARPPQPARASASAVPNSLLGIALGMDLDDVHRALKVLGASGSADADKATGDADNQDKDADKPKRPAQDEDGDEGHQEAWTLRGTPYARLAFATDDQDKVMWVTGFVRPGQEIPFAKFGDLSKAAGRSNDRVVWNVIRPHNLYRLMAGGKDGKAGVVSLISLRPANPNGIFSPQIVPHTLQGKQK